MRSMLVLVEALLLIGCAPAPLVVSPPPQPVEAASGHLAALIRIRADEPGAAPAVLAWLTSTYPALMARAEREDFPRAITLTWKGLKPTEGPLVLMAHLDTVPVDGESEWTVPPYGGDIHDGFIWGRGALDDKGQAVALLEALEALAATGFEPRRSIVVSFGFDEERGGSEGAVVVAETFKRRGVVPYLVIDEGIMPTTGVVAGLDVPLAVIGTAEKGSLTVELSTTLPGGHSSMPPKESAVGLLARAALKLEQHQLAPRLIPSVRQLLGELAPHFPLGRRLAMQNLWLLEGAVIDQLLQSDTSAATVRTSTALATFKAGIADNVIAVNAVAHVNFRILQGDTIESVLAHVTSVIADPRVSVRAVGLDDREASAESERTGPAWEAVRAAVRETFPDAVVSPGLVMAGTDSRHFASFCAHVYRFAPFLLTRDDLARIHGIDERLSEAELARGVAFYRRLVGAVTR